MTGGSWRAAEILTLGAVALAPGGCGGPPPPEAAAPIRVVGSRADRRVLEGTWSGEFRNERTGRTGTIRFTLAPGEDTAYARVVVPGGALAPGCGDALTRATSDEGSGEFLLRLAQLKVEAGSVGGWLAPYHDPDAGCVMDTWFEGLARKGFIEGTYFSRPADGTSVRIGRWEVRREAQGARR